MTDSREPAPFADEGGRASRAPRAARRRPSAGADARDDEARRRVRKDDRLSTRRPNPGTEGAGERIAVRWLPVEALTPDKRNARIHSARQVARIADSIAAFGFNVPILVDEKRGVLAGHGRLLAAKRLGLREAPTITLGHLNEARRRAFVIADNRLGELASWDQARLGAELKELKSLDLDFGIELTGFEMSEIDLRIEARPSAPCDAVLHPAAPGSQSGGRPAPSDQASSGAALSRHRAFGRTPVFRRNPSSGGLVAATFSRKGRRKGEATGDGGRAGGRHVGSRPSSASLRGRCRRCRLLRARRRDPAMAEPDERKRTPPSDRRDLRFG